MARYRSPGVYVDEEDAFPNSVVQVATAVPVFIGYTEFASRNCTDLMNVPTRIGSLSEYAAQFGGAPNFGVAMDAATGALRSTSPFMMSRSLKLFYANGGGACYIVSVGPYTRNGQENAPNADAIIAALNPLEKEPEPTMVLTPETALMGRAGWSKVARAVLGHCTAMRNRIAIFDVVGGTIGPGQAGSPDPAKDFQEDVGNDGLSYAAAYYPWLNTSLLSIDDVTFSVFSDAARAALQKAVEAEADTNGSASLRELAGAITDSDLAGSHASQRHKPETAHKALKAASRAYNDAITAALAAVNVMPPGGAMAGVISRVDTNVGPWQAPANTPIADVVSPTVMVTDEQQADLNAPLNGKSINCIRHFIGEGTLVWGARTLDSNSLDWRYIPVRRTAIMIEQSMKLACQAHVFSANDHQTRTSVTAMLENFLEALWKQGALQGAAPQDAYAVDVGLGSTMTPQDVHEGNMIVSAKVALTHPAEYIVLSIRLKMQGQ